jgi:hypothetical protein
MKRSILAAVAALSLFGVGGAVAQSSPGMGSPGMGGPGMGGPGMGRGNPAMAAVRQACAADMQKYCADKMGPDRRQCMQDHAADLSDGCKSAIANMRAQMKAPPEQRPQ